MPAKLTGRRSRSIALSVVVHDAIGVVTGLRGHRPAAIAESNVSEIMGLDGGSATQMRSMKIAGKAAKARPQRAAPASRRQLQKSQTLAHLTKAANDLFLRKGYVNTTIDDISARAGASRATFYLHFSKKWHVLKLLVEEKILPDSLKTYRQLDEITDLSAESVSAWLNEALDRFVRHLNLLRVVHEAESVEPEMTHFNLECMRKCVDAMPNYLARWRPERETFARLRLNMLISQLDRSAGWLIQEGEEFDKEMIVSALLEFWLIVLRGAGNARDLE